MKRRVRLSLILLAAAALGAAAEACRDIDDPPPTLPVDPTAPGDAGDAAPGDAEPDGSFT